MRASELRSAIDEVRALLGDLGERVARLEAGAAAAVAQAVATPPPAAAPAAALVPAVPAGVPEAVILTISAAVAAFFGERAHVRQIRLIRTGAWAQQGRVSVQASHRLQR